MITSIVNWFKDQYTFVTDEPGTVLAEQRSVGDHIIDLISDEAVLECNFYGLTGYPDGAFNGSPFESLERAPAITHLLPNDGGYILLSTNCRDTYGPSGGFAYIDGHVFKWKNTQLNKSSLSKLNKLLVFNNIVLRDKKFYERISNTKWPTVRKIYKKSDAASKLVASFLESDYILANKTDYYCRLESNMGVLNFWIGNKFYGYGAYISFHRGGNKQEFNTISIDSTSMMEIAVFNGDI